MIRRVKGFELAPLLTLKIESKYLSDLSLISTKMNILCMEIDRKLSLVLGLTLNAVGEVGLYEQRKSVERCIMASKKSY